MCGRFASISITPDDLEAFGLAAQSPCNLIPRYNIAPAQMAPVIPNLNKSMLEMFRWGLIPSWAKDPWIGNRLINARAETLAQKPSFREAFRHRRCLVPADGFFEWKREKSTKLPFFIRLKSKKPFAIAGLWECWQSADKGPIRTFTIITTEANQLVSGIHNRMPVILSPKDYKAWLSNRPADPEILQETLGVFPASKMEAYPVSRLVNNPYNDKPEVILPS